MRELQLTQGKVAFVDDDDFEGLSRFKWYSYRSRRRRLWYCCAPIEGVTVLLHRFILGAPTGMTVDHINGNGLDNRKANLRVLTQADNCINRAKNHNSRSQYKGVCLHRKTGRWWARISFQGKTHSLGTHLTEREAAAAYDVASIKLHGTLGRLNFPIGGPP